VRCSSCGTENEPGRKFCSECGAPLARTCSACGSANAPSAKFCGECGAALTEHQAAARPAPTPAAERRLVTVLFADLVGFTSLSEQRDSEEVRALQSRYFDTSRRLIELYGGTVEKFIGDAVMAVWGTPTATEDDPERAVRAALDLAASVTALGDELGVTTLRARVGVLTGEAAVTIGAEGEGMVTGDVVNTASRIQSLAEPGQVLVGESTRRATEPTIAYADAGSHELKGKTGLVPLWRAQRVVSGARGALKSQGLEAPFVGRDRELRLIKDLFHDCERERRAQLVSITGIAGIGKSRLSWEFYKYFDGIAQITYWHRGRCLSYGEGVTYWALADMVRMRARIAEDEEPASSLAKLRGVVAQHMADEGERTFAEPRLAHLLGLDEGSGYERDDLFAAWRLFFERLADVYPVVLAFEDMQWADASLLDFVEYLLEWSRSSPICVVTLARPELLERRPTWGAGSRNFTSVYLDPLSQPAMEELLDGLVPGLPDELRAQILERSEGIPLYAVETVRMLLDRGLLRLEGSAYRPAGPIAALEVPETLHGLIAARLDGLPAEERRVVQDASVVGKTFTKEALAALAAVPEAELERTLTSLTRKEIFGLQADPRSPEHGQYGFLQDLLRRVAYETLARSERKARHLAAAAFLEQSLGEQEVVEVVASHYVNAYNAAPDAADAAAIKAKALERLSGAGERAASLGASQEAKRYFEQAAALADEPPEHARLLDRAGQMAWKGGDAAGAVDLFESAHALYEAEGDAHAAALVSGRIAEVERFTGRIAEGVERLDRALAVIAGSEPDEDHAELMVRSAMGHWALGHQAEAWERIEVALEIAEARAMKGVLARGFITKAAISLSRGRFEEARALLEHALKLAVQSGHTEAERSANFILSDQAFHRDRYADAFAYLENALAVTRRTGDVLGGWSVTSETTYPLYMLGRWDEALAAAAEVPEEQIERGGMLLSLLSSTLEIHAHRGELEEARRQLSLFDGLSSSSDRQDQAGLAGAQAAVALAEGRYADALEAGVHAVEVTGPYGITHQCAKQGFVHAVEAAIALGDTARADELLRTVEELPVAARSPFYDAQVLRFRAKLSGDGAGFARAAAIFRQLELPFWLAVTLLEQSDPAGVAEAREIFERLGATRWLERLDGALSAA
jgi:class 3 adenylate cyclase/tetratricopeptide (TPR) repeat protein